MSTLAYNFNYKPTGITSNSKPAGLSLYGIDGDDGTEGSDGITTYFYDEEVINDTIKESILNDMDNGVMFRRTDLVVRPYKIGDLIIFTKKRNSNLVYIVTEPEPGSTHNFNIKDFGTIEQPQPIHAIVEQYLPSASLGINVHFDMTQTKMPVNRSFDTSANLYYTNGNGVDVSTGGNVPYHHALKDLFGFYIEPTISFNNYSIPYAYDFYLKITIPLKKGLVGKNGYTLEPGYSDDFSNDPDDDHFETEPTRYNRDIVKFEKIIEIPMTKFVNGEKVDWGDLPYTTYISEMTGDKLHPAGNNINTSFFDPRQCDGWQMNANEPMLHWFHITYANGVYTAFGKSLQNGTFTNAKRVDYYINKIEKPLMKKSYIELHPMIQMSKRQMYDENVNLSNLSMEYPNQIEENPYQCIINFRSGESAYFSGMTPRHYYKGWNNINCFSPEYDGRFVGSGPNQTYDAYVMMNRCINQYNDTDVDVSTQAFHDHLGRRRWFMNEYIRDQLYRFIFSRNNTFEVVYVEKTSGLTKSIIKPIGHFIFNETPEP